MFCHDASRYVLFIPSLRKVDFADLDSLFRPLFLTSLAAFGATPKQIRKAQLALGPLLYDTATDRSAQGSIRNVQNLDLQGIATKLSGAMLDPLAVSVELSHRPATIRGKWLWPDLAMLEAVARL